MTLARRKARSGWFPLSEDARALLADPASGWEYVELMDGPAAQALVPGVRARPAPPDLFTPAAPERAADPDQQELSL